MKSLRLWRDSLINGHLKEAKSTFELRPLRRARTSAAAGPTLRHLSISLVRTAGSSSIFSQCGSDHPYQESLVCDLELI